MIFYALEISSIIFSQLVRPFSLHMPLCGGAVPTIPVRKRDGISNRHWNPAFRKQRNWKVKIAHEGNQETNIILLRQVLKVDLPDYDKDLIMRLKNQQADQGNLEAMYTVDPFHEDVSIVLKYIYITFSMI